MRCAIHKLWSRHAVTLRLVCPQLLPYPRYITFVEVEGIVSYIWSWQTVGIGSVAGNLPILAGASAGLKWLTRINDLIKLILRHPETCDPARRIEGKALHPGQPFVNDIPPKLNAAVLTY
jgi:hypothetical protein